MTCNKLQQLLGVPVDVLTPKTLPDAFGETVLVEAGDGGF